MRLYLFTILWILYLPVHNSYADKPLRWYGYAFGGKMFTDNLVDVPERLFALDLQDSKLLAVGGGKELYHLGEWITFEGEGQVARHLGQIQKHTELNTSLNIRWNRFPWDAWLNTTIAWGHGFSYATKKPPLEIADAGNTSHLLYYKIIEADMALPNHDEWKLFTRVHHRSGIFGTINNVDGGSNAMVLGIKKFF